MPPGALEAIEREVKDIATLSTTDAVRAALNVGLVFSIISILVSGLLPNSRKIETEQTITAGH